MCSQTMYRVLRNNKLKIYGKEQSWPNLWNYPAFARVNERARKISLMIAGLQTDI